MPQINKVIRCEYRSHRMKATTIGTDGHFTFVRYHQTKVVQWSTHIILLYTGGWYTPTTVRRMNQASNQFNLGFSVYRRNGTYYVMFAGKVRQFTHFITLNRREGRVFISSSGKTYPGNFI